MRFVLIAVTTVLCLWSSFARAQWTDQDMSFTVDVILGSDFTDPNNGIMVGYEIGTPIMSKVLRTTNGGTTWTEPFVDSVSITDVYFTSPTVGYFTGGNFVYAYMGKTTDGGATWDTITLPYNETMDAIHFPSASVGYATGEAMVLKTTDAGANWNVLTDLGFFLTHDLHFVNDNTGFVVAQMDPSNDSRIYRTQDGGTTWDTVFTKNNTNFTAIDFPSVMVGYACADNADVYKTTDGGATWTTIATLSASDLRDIEFVSNLEGYAVGTGTISGAIYYTSNGGNTWTQDYSTFGVSPAYYTLDLISGTGYAAGGGGYSYNPNIASGINNDYPIEKRFSVYPNPSTGVLTVHSTQDGIVVQKIEVYNLAGELVYEAYPNGSRIDLTGLDNGCYVLGLINEDQIGYKRIIISK